MLKKNLKKEKINYYQYYYRRIIFRLEFLLLLLLLLDDVTALGAFVRPNSPNTFPPDSMVTIKYFALPLNIPSLRICKFLILNLPLIFPLTINN